MRLLLLFVLVVAALARDHPPRVHVSGPGYEMYCLGDCDSHHTAHHTEPALGMFGGWFSSHFPHDVALPFQIIVYLTCCFAFVRWHGSL